MKRSRRVLCVAAATWFCTSAVQGANVAVNFTGAVDGDYANELNWNPVRVPGVTDGDTTTWDQVTISNTTATLATDLFGNKEVGPVVLTNATLNVNAGGYLYQDYAGAWNNGWLRSTNSIVTINGTHDAYGMYIVGGTMTINNGGSVFARGHYRELGSGAIVNVGGIYGGVPEIMIGTHNDMPTATRALGATVNVTTGGNMRSQRGTFVDNGPLNVNGGNVYTTGLIVGHLAGYSSAMVNQTSGGVYLGTWNNGSASIGREAPGLYQISGGTLGMSRYDDSGASNGWGDGIRNFDIGTGASAGRFRIIGNDASINIANITNTSSPPYLNIFTLGANGTLEWVVDDTTVTTIFVNGGTNLTVIRNATLGGVIDMGVDPSFTPAAGAVYDLVTASGSIIDTGYTLAAEDASLWTLSVVGTVGSGQTLQATYVPEPGTFGLLGVVVSGILLRRNGRR